MPTQKPQSALFLACLVARCARGGGSRRLCTYHLRKANRMKFDPDNLSESQLEHLASSGRQSLAPRPGAPAPRILTKILRRFAEQLPVHLEDPELLERAQSLSQQHARLQEHESRAKMVKDQLKADEAQIQSEIGRLALVIRDKAEPRAVDVNEVADYDRGKVAVVRLDTGAIVRERALEMHERQDGLFDGVQAGEDSGT